MGGIRIRKSPPGVAEIAEPILWKVLGVDTEMKWMRGGNQERGTIEVEELRKEEVQEWTDGNRSRDRAAGVPQGQEEYM